MSRFFNNKWFVFALGCAAITICGFNIAGPLMGGTDLDSASVVPAVGLEGDVPPSNPAFSTHNEAHNGTHTDSRTVNSTTALPEKLNTLGWNPSVTRNPFSLEQTTMPDDAGPEEVVSEVQADDMSMPAPALTAVVIANNIRVAVIDGAIVHLGSASSAGEVTAINGRSIAIKDPDENIRNIPWTRASQ
jgi:hypothetical protein